MTHRFAAHFAGFRPIEIPQGALKPSAVLLLLAGAPHREYIVFQVRTQTVRHHKGEISLPGGRRDPDDPSFLHTALRETHEEVGVAPEFVHVLGALDDVETRGSGHLIRPYVGVLAPGAQVQVTASREVAELLHVPLTQLQDEASRVWHVADHDGTAEARPAFAYGEHVIWGATARIVDQFLQLVGGKA